LDSKNNEEYEKEKEIEGSLCILAHDAAAYLNPEYYLPNDFLTVRSVNR
jgi:hypothetical protein